MMLLTQNSTQTLQFGPFLDEDDGKTVESGLTIAQADVRLSKNGGAFAQKNDASTASYDENGYYRVSFSTTDTNTVGTLLIAIHKSGALPVWREFHVVPNQVYASLVEGSDKLEVDQVQLGGVTQSATDLKHFADSGYDPATSKVEGVKTVDTLSGHTPQTGDSFARLGAPVAASISADLQVVDGNVDDIETRVTLALPSAAPGGAGGVPTVDASNYIAGIQGTKNQLDDLNDVSAAEVNTEADAALSDIHLDHLLAVADSDTPVDNSIIAKLAAKGATADWSTFDNTQDSLENLRDIQSSILGDTGSLVAGQGTILSAVSAVETDTQDIQVQIGTAGAGLTDLGGMSTGMKAEVEQEVTDALNAYDPPTSAEMVARTLPSADYFDPATDPVELLDSGGSAGTSADELVDDIWNELQSGHTTAGTFGKYLDTEVSGVGGGAGLSPLSSGTAQAGAPGSITLAISEPSMDDYYKGEKVVIKSGTGAGQARIVTGYTGSSRVATVSPDWKTAPDSSSLYELQAAESNLGAILHDGVHGNNATLRLKRWDVVNPTDDAVFFESQATNKAGMHTKGGGGVSLQGAGQYNEGGADSPGMHNQGGSGAVGLRNGSGGGAAGMHNIGEKEGLLNECAGSGGFPGVRNKGGGLGTNAPGVIDEAGTTGSGSASGHQIVGYGVAGHGLECVRGGASGRDIDANELINIEADTQDIQTQIGVAGAGLTDLGGMSTTMQGQIGTIVDSKLDTVVAEPPPGTPSTTGGLRWMMAWTWMVLRNKGTMNKTTGEKTFHNSSGVPLAKKVVTDDGTTYQENSMVAP